MLTTAEAPMFVRVMGLPLRLALYVLACLILIAADARYDALSVLRASVATVLHPVQAGLTRPFRYLQEASDFFVVHGELVRENHRLQAEGERLMHAVQDQALLRSENSHLRGLLQLPVPPGFTSHTVEIVQALTNPFSRLVVINRGGLQGITPGWPVVDARGLVGQVTRVFPGSSEVTLITSQEQAVPVQVVRNGLRLIVSGIGQDRLLEVRFLDMHADIKPDDVLMTSGLDGVYPPGIPVARVLVTEPPRHTPFARAVCAPLAGVGQQRQLLVLQQANPAVAPVAAPIQPALTSPVPTRLGPSPAIRP